MSDTTQGTTHQKRKAVHWDAYGDTVLAKVARFYIKHIDNLVHSQSLTRRGPYKRYPYKGQLYTKINAIQIVFQDYGVFEPETHKPYTKQQIINRLAAWNRPFGSGWPPEAPMETDPDFYNAFYPLPTDQPGDDSVRETTEAAPHPMVDSHSGGTAPPIFSNPHDMPDRSERGRIEFSPIPPGLLDTHFPRDRGGDTHPRVFGP